MSKSRRKKKQRRDAPSSAEPSPLDTQKSLPRWVAPALLIGAGIVVVLLYWNRTRPLELTPSPNILLISVVTLPSHTSLFTGSYPIAHGVRDNGSFRLDDEQETITEIFRRAGYQTAVFIRTAPPDRYGNDIAGVHRLIAELRAAGH